MFKKRQVEASLVIEAADKSDDVLEINYQNNRVFTRDQLLVTGFLDGEEINIIESLAFTFWRKKIKSI
jgi:hypothetical protein